jgi:hypothetical protein
VTSDRKITANRENARASTGPKTVQGRARAAQNHFRHGLSLAVHSDPAWSEEVRTLAREIGGANANADVQALACRLAEAHIDLRRIRQARHRLLSDALGDPYFDSRANKRDKLALLHALLGKDPPDMSMEKVVKFVTSTPERPQKFATILAQEASRLWAMDRYERRALSRRKSAVRAFDEARQRHEPLRERSL